MASTAVLTFPDRTFMRSKWQHALHLFVMSASIVSISTVAIFYSLGYQINWTGLSIRRTGLVTLDIGKSQFTADVIINGSRTGHVSFPYRSAPLFPGVYTVQVKRDGYQKWQRTLSVVANEVNDFHDIVLVLNTPATHVVSDADRSSFDSTPDRHDISVRQNELYVAGTFVTRTSQYILNASWYPDGKHLVYQQGGVLWLADQDGLRTQQLVEVQGNVVIDYRFRDNGRILIYQDESGLHGLELL
ncbi:MAG: PEGA domain-containing protein [bacterium]